MCSNKTFAEPDVPGVTNFSLKDLKQLVDHKSSCVSCVSQCVRSIDLMPLHLKDLKSSIQELLRSKVTKYDVELQGIILAHKNVKVNARSVQLSDHSSFPLAYQADIYVFKPQIGSTLTGIVNKIASNAEHTTYISVLVHNMFNVAVYSDGQPKWRQIVSIGSEVTVKVVLINYTGRMPYIKGTIISPTSEWDEEDEVDGSKKRKHLKKKKLKDMETDVAGPQKKEIYSILKNSPCRKSGMSSTEVESHESSSTESAKAPKSDLSSSSLKKKKKKNRELNGEPPLSVNDVEAANASKKRKRDFDGSSDSVTPSKKKKKKDKSKDEHRLSLNNYENSILKDEDTLPANEQIASMGQASIAPSLSLPPPPTTPTKKKKTATSDSVEKIDPLRLSKEALRQSIVHVKEELTSTVGALSSKKKRSSNDESSSSIDTESPAALKTKKKKKIKEVRSMNEVTAELMQQALDQIKPAQDVSISKATSSTPLPNLPLQTSLSKKKKKTNSNTTDKTDPEPETPEVSLRKSMIRVKKELTSTLPSDGPQPETEKVQSKRRKKKTTRDEGSSSVDTNIPPSAVKRKKKVRDERSINDITSDLMEQALKQIKSEI